MTQSRISLSIFILALAAPLGAQTAQPVGSPQPSAASSAPAAPATLPSAILRPAMQSLQQALALAHPEKWKAPSAITAESATDIGSIQRDLEQTLPPLVTSSDASPNSVSQLLPAYRNVEALYDVVVRVTQTSVLAAPPQQSTAFQQATLSLQQARREFGDLLTADAQSQDRRVHDVQARLTALQSAPPPAAPVCPPPPPAKKVTPKKKSTSTAKPATP
jgi:hypothetical protein